MILAIVAALSGPALAQPETTTFRQVSRPGSVDLDAEYNLKGLLIPRDEIHTLLPRDAIPALTDPKTQQIKSATWLSDNSRIIAISHNGETLGVPINVLDWHEVVNTTLGGEPIAATYCPLCDSATVFSRAIRPVGAAPGTKPVVLEFGVSGALYNSNVLMYDRRDRGLWSQLAMKAVSGPLAGTPVATIPFEIIPFSEFAKRFPSAPVVSNETGHQRNYERSPYQSYFANENLMVPVRSVGDALPRKTLGVGVSVGDKAWFLPIETVDGSMTLDTPAGKVKVSRGKAGVVIDEAPTEAQIAQTFYYSWSAFYPNTDVVTGSLPLPTR